MILLEDGHCLTDQALEVCGRDKNHAQINLGAASMATLTQLVGAGFGLTLMPEIAAPFEVSGRDAVQLRRFTGVEPKRQIGLLRRETSLDGDWGADLCRVLSDAGRRPLPARAPAFKILHSGISSDALQIQKFVLHRPK